LKYQAQVGSATPAKHSALRPKIPTKSPKKRLAINRFHHNADWIYTRNRSLLPANPGCRVLLAYSRKVDSYFGHRPILPNPIVFHKSGHRAIPNEVRLALDKQKKYKTQASAGISKQKCLKMPANKRLSQF
jgi:hypothetical protein